MIHSEDDLVRIPGILGYAAKRDGTIWMENSYKGQWSGRVIYQTGKWREVPAKPDKKTGYRIVSINTKLIKSIGDLGPDKRKMIRVHALIAV